MTGRDVLEADAVRSFAVFAEHLNFTAAAAALRVSQPSLHVKISKLAAALGADLYQRQGRSLRLTAAGERLAAFALDGPADVTLAIYDRRHSTPVHEGENNGRMLENFNVVRRLESVATWKGAAASWTIPADRMAPEQGAAVLVQRADHGAMLGCAKLEPPIS